MRVSLARASSPSALAPALLDRADADVILGTQPDARAAPIAPGANTLFGPRGAALAGADGPLLVCDTGHHRVVGWRACPVRDGQPSDFVLGQPDFHAEGRNGNGPVHAASLNVPTGIAIAGDILAVADAWNHRVLLWRGLAGLPRPADAVVGQADFAAGEANRGGRAPRADTLHWPYGVTIASGRLLVADTGNRRVLVWNAIPRENGVPADLVLGQRDFAIRDENAGEGVGARGMRWPHAMGIFGDNLLVADAGSNRVMGWRNFPDESGAPCDFVLGQGAVCGGEHNRGAYNPTAAALNMPYGLAVCTGRLVVADTANSRLLGFERLETDAGACALAGQHRFDEKGDNRWKPAARDSLCWPYGIAACDGRLVVCDSGNNRVLLWRT